jgi:BASS family bile acid:Na+ symporter
MRFINTSLFSIIRAGERTPTLARRIGGMFNGRNLLVTGICLLVLAAVAAGAGRYAPAGTAVTAALMCAALATFSSGRWKSLAFTIWVLAFACAALFFPSVFVSWRDFELKNLIVPLIQVIMFGMGTTLTFRDFERVVRMPVSVLIGFVLQFTIMPLGGWFFAAAFNLKGPVAAGLILIGSCPGGVSSNVLTYIAGANVALSVTMTACSTLMSPVMTPLGMKILAGQYVPIEAGQMMLSIVYMILFPVLGGLFLGRYAGGVTRHLGRWMPFVSMLSICIIIAVTIALSRDQLFVVGPALFAASVCHNATGFVLGYAGSRALGLNRIDSRTVSIEVGIQNGGMATGLAFNVLGSAQAAMASAVFGPWSAVAGSALASLWRRRRLSPA